MPIFFAMVLFNQISISQGSARTAFDFDFSHADTIYSEIKCYTAQAWVPIHMISSAFESYYLLPAGATSPSQMNDNATAALLFSTLRSLEKEFVAFYTGFTNGKMISYGRNYNDQVYKTPFFSYVKDENTTCNYEPYSISSNFSCRFFYVDATNPITGKIAGKPSKAIAYDPRVRPWYIGAKNSKNGTFWTDIYAFASTSVGITASKRIISASGIFLGCIGSNLQLKMFENILSDNTNQELNLGPEIFTFIVDRNFGLVAASTKDVSWINGEQVQAVNCSVKDVALTARHFEQLPMKYEESRVQMFAGNGLQYWGLSKPIRDKHGLDWHMIMGQYINCPRTYYANASGFCVKCESPAFSFGEGATTCNECEKKYIRNSDGECRECSKGMMCTMDGVTVGNVVIEEGWYRFNKRTTQVHKCPIEELCKRNGTCTKGSRGPLCTLCENEYYLDASDKKCKRCEEFSPGPSALLLYFGLTVIFLLCVALFVISFAPTTHQKILLIKHHAIESRKAFMKYIKTEKAGRIFRKMRILYIYFQLISGFTWIFGSEIYPDNFMQATVPAQFLSFDFVKAFPINCIFRNQDYFDLVAEITIPPILVCAVLLILHKKRKDKSCVAWLQAFLLVLFCILPPCSSKIFSALDCRTYKGYEDDDDTVKFLRVDYQIECTSERYRSLIILTSVMIFVYPIGIPCLFAILLWRAREALVEPLIMDYINEKQRATVRTLRASSLALSEERRSTIVSTIHHRLRSISTTTMKALHGPRGIFLFFLSDETRGKIRGRNEEVKRQQEVEWMEITAYHKLNFLLSSYARRVYWYEVIETLRRISLSGMLVIYGVGSRKQIVLGCFTCLIFLRIDTLYSPLRGDDDNVLQEICNWQLFSVLFATLLLSWTEWDEDTQKQFGGIIIIIVYVPIMCYFLVLFLNTSKNVTGLSITRYGRGSIKNDSDSIKTEQFELSLTEIPRTRGYTTNPIVPSLDTSNEFHEQKDNSVHLVEMQGQDARLSSADSDQNNLSEIEAGLTESNNSSGFVGSENPSNKNQ